MRLMHQKEFVWIIPNDDNRVNDGLDLRTEFINEHHSRRHLTRESFGPCTVLELLIGLSRRLAFHAGGEAEEWACQLLDNLGLLEMKDPISKPKIEETYKILDDLIWRQYRFDGIGGFFPLSYPQTDQAKLEIWYQMHAYVLEIHPDY
jgi:hypothetical protein